MTYQQYVAISEIQNNQFEPMLPYDEKRSPCYYVRPSGDKHYGFITT